MNILQRVHIGLIRTIPTETKKAAHRAAYTCDPGVRIRIFVYKNQRTDGESAKRFDRYLSVS